MRSAASGPGGGGGTARADEDAKAAMSGRSFGMGDALNFSCEIRK
jgi:hypothetical protein